jgi:hypothetical protein
MNEEVNKTFLSFDIEQVNNQIPAIGVVLGSIGDQGEFEIKDGKTFYGKVKYKEEELDEFWQKNIEILKKSQENAITQKQMANELNEYLIEIQKAYPNFIVTSDNASFDIGELNTLMKTHNIKPMKFRRNDQENFFQDLDITSFAAGILFALDPKSAFQEDWEWGQFKKIFKKLGIKVENKYEHDHNPQNDASKNIFDFLKLLKYGIQEGILNIKDKENSIPIKKDQPKKRKRKLEEGDKKSNKKRKLNHKI